MIQMVEKAWERTVAQAAPLTPIPNVKMNKGSRMQLEIAPTKTESMAWLLASIEKAGLPKPEMEKRERTNFIR